MVTSWKIGQRLWTRDYAGVHEAIREFNLIKETNKSYLVLYEFFLFLNLNCKNAFCILHAEKIWDHKTAEVAIDFYHRYKVYVYIS